MLVIFILLLFYPTWVQARLTMILPPPTERSNIFSVNASSWPERVNYPTYGYLQGDEEYMLFNVTGIAEPLAMSKHVPCQVTYNPANKMHHFNRTRFTSSVSIIQWSEAAKAGCLTFAQVSV
jgi:hypothetical protein